MDLIYAKIYENLPFLDRLNLQEATERRLNRKKETPKFYCFICQSLLIDKLLATNWSEWTQSISYRQFVGDAILLNFFLDIVQNYLVSVFHTECIGDFESHLYLHMSQKEGSFYSYHTPLTESHLSTNIEASNYMLKLFQNMAQFHMSWPKLPDGSAEFCNREAAVFSWLLYNVRIYNTEGVSYNRDILQENDFALLARLFETKLADPEKYKSSKYLRVLVLGFTPVYAPPILRMLGDPEKHNVAWKL